MKKTLIKLYKATIGKINYMFIKNKDVTIISNNCYAGIFYRNNNLKYLSPTLGLFFIASEYIKFIYNIKYYLNQELTFIEIEQSKFSDYLYKINYNGVIGKLDDVEIMFLHYNSKQEAYEKWNRRKERINWNKIIYKFSDQNLCRYEDLKKFNDFDAKNKILFTTRKYDTINSIQIKKYSKCENLPDDIKSSKKYFNMIKYINNMEVGKNE